MGQLRGFVIITDLHTGQKWTLQDWRSS